MLPTRPMKAAAATTVSIDWQCHHVLEGYFCVRRQTTPCGQHAISISRDGAPTSWLHQFESSHWIVLLQIERKPHDAQPEDFEEPQINLWICDEFTRSGNMFC